MPLMAGAREGEGPDLNLKAAADLSAKQFTAIKLDSSGDAAAATAQGEKTVGILQNAPAAAGRAARVRYEGKSKALLGGTVSAMDALTTGTDGKLEASATADNELCTALQSGVANDIIDVIFKTFQITP